MIRPVGGAYSTFKFQYGISLHAIHSIVNHDNYNTIIIYVFQLIKRKHNVIVHIFNYCRTSTCTLLAHNTHIQKFISIML